MCKLFKCLVLCALAPGNNAFAATIPATANTSAAVQAAINSAANGDTVTVPAGSGTWSSGVSIPNTKYITLDGGGSTIALSGTLSITPHATGNSRVTGFTFNCNGGGVWVYDQLTTACWRIDHCTFTGSGTIINLYARGAGLMDHCTFPSIAAAQETMHLWGWGASDTTGWTTPVAQDHLFYIEDCTFNGAQGNSSCCFQGYYGSRVCARYNSVTGAMYEQHGTAGMMGARWWEFYGNRLTDMVICLRAGSGVVHDNNCSGVNLAMQEEDSGYPAAYQIGRGINNTLDPAYYWNNVGVTVFLNANNVCAVGVPNMVQLNRDVYASAKPGYTPYPYPHPLISGKPTPPLGFHVAGP